MTSNIMLYYVKSDRATKIDTLFIAQFCYDKSNQTVNKSKEMIIYALSYIITQDNTIIGCILFYNPYRVFLKIPCDTNLITALTKWFDAILHERNYVL